MLGLKQVKQDTMSVDKEEKGSFEVSSSSPSCEIRSSQALGNSGYQ